MGVGTGWDALSKPSIDVGHLLSCICWQSDLVILCSSSACIWVFVMRIEGANKKKRREVFLLCAGPLVSFQAFILTLALASEMFDPLLSNKSVCGGSGPVCSSRRGCRMKRIIQWTVMGEGVGLAVSNREDLTVSGVILKVNLQELNMFKE